MKPYVQKPLSQLKSKPVQKSFGGCMAKQTIAHPIMEYHSITTWREILTRATTRTTLERVMQSKKSQSQNVSDSI